MGDIQGRASEVDVRSSRQLTQYTHHASCIPQYTVYKYAEFILATGHRYPGGDEWASAFLQLTVA
jgi:hypothetical protein